MKVSTSCERLKELMARRGLKQRDIVRLTGIPKSTISLYINGKRDPRQDRLIIISETFNINPVWLMGFDTVMTKEENAIDKYIYFADKLEMENVLQKYNQLNSVGKKKINELLDDYLKIYKDDKIGV